MDTLRRFLNILYMNNAEPYFVGGYVRDKILGKINKDIDIEIYNISQEKFEDLLGRYTEVDLVGKSFGVYKANFDGIDIDFSFPRKEVKTGEKHTDFEIVVDPFISTREASIRRDLTINAIMEHCITGEIVDNFNGIEDLENKILRMVDSKTFQEDTLRTLRVCQFASRFGFEIEEETKNFMKTIDLNTISQERFLEEFKKGIEKGNPKVFFKNLYENTRFSEIVKTTYSFANLPEYPILLNDILPVMFSPNELKKITNRKDLLKLSEIAYKLSQSSSLTKIIEYSIFYQKQIEDYFRMLYFVKGKIFTNHFKQAYFLASKYFLTGEQLLDFGIKPGKIVGEMLFKDKFNKIQLFL